jgi:hypothetical protein
MNASKVKNFIKWLLKLGLSSLALFFVFKKVDPNTIIETAFSANPLYLVLALCAFNISKIISSFRLNQFYKAIKVDLSERYNLALYYLSMFYNLFLPGSIGGDAYKVYLLRQEGKGNLKSLSIATLLDRVNGLVLLFFLSCLLILLNKELHQVHFLIPFSVAGILLAIPCYYLLNKMFFKAFVLKFWIVTHLSFWVQMGQLLSAFFILKAVGIQGDYLDYLVIFMASSVVAVFPFSIGGVGARELVFLYAHQFMSIDEEKAISFTLLFFSTLVVSSLPGIYFMIFPYQGKKYIKNKNHL